MRRALIIVHMIAFYGSLIRLIVVEYNVRSLGFALRAALLLLFLLVLNMLLLLLFFPSGNFRSQLLIIARL